MHSLSKNDYIGFLLLSIGIIDVVHTVLYKPLYELLWFSNSILVLAGLAFIFQSRLLIGSVLISSVVEIPWVVDFFGRLAFDKVLLGGVADYMLNDFGFSSARFYIELNHLLVIPFSVYGALKIGIHRQSYVVSSIHAVLLNTLSFFFAPAAKNINCMRHLCISGRNFSGGAKYFIGFTLFLCVLAYFINLGALRIFKHRNSINLND